MAPTRSYGEVMKSRPATTLLAGLLLLSLTACRTSRQEDYSVMMRYDDSITTIPVEMAKNSAMFTKDTLRPSVGKYCLTFREDIMGNVSTGRVELTLLDDKRYQRAERYTYKNLVKSMNEIGVYRMKGHALTMINQAGQERTWPLTTLTPNQLNIFGNLPLSRDACVNATPLSGDALAQATAKAIAEQADGPPWKKDEDGSN